ncbi:MAG: hypothetical protein ABSE73_04425 [Planctomycetota bacterium]
MDQALAELIGKVLKVDKSKVGETRGGVRFLDMAKGEIELSGAGGTTQYALKPLVELYGEGQGVSAVDPQDDRFMSLFMAIEEESVRYYHLDPELTDGVVTLTLDRLVRNPSAQFQTSELGAHLQATLRFCLSTHNHSKWEVQQALKKIVKSVERHTKVAGIRGYLDFIDAHFPYVP